MEGKVIREVVSVGVVDRSLAPLSVADVRECRLYRKDAKHAEDREVFATEYTA